MAKAKRRPLQKYCSQQCWLKQHNNPERNAKVARETAQQRGDEMAIPGEVVHHIDEDKSNYSEDNLMLFASQKEHARWHSNH